MAPRNRNRNNNRMPSRATTPAAPAPVQQPRPNFPGAGTARYVENVNPKGTAGYEYWSKQLGPGYDGGGWAATTGTPGVDAITDDDLRAWSKATSLKGTLYDYGSLENVRRLAAEFDAQQAAQSQAAQAQTASPAAQNYRGLKSINQGLKLGGDTILGRREAMKIARGTGRDFDKVLTKALGQGMSIGGGAVRQSNRAYEKSGQAGMDRAMGALAGESPLSEMRRVTPGKRQMYSGTYQLDGKTMPLIESRRGGVASNLGGMGDGRRNRNKNNRRNKRGRGGAGDMESTGMETSQTPQTPMTPMEPMTPEQMQEASTIDINMPGVGADVFSSATGYRSKRSSRKLAGRTAAGLASQRINPTGSWRYGV